MSISRKPARDTYDAVIDLETVAWEAGRATQTAYALVKQTFLVIDGKCHLDAPEPMLHDWRDASQVPRLVAGTDFWPLKRATDVVVQGSAFSPGLRPIDRVMVAVTVGSLHKSIAVLGNRRVAFTHAGVPRIGYPAPFVEMPLTLDRAYGGLDARVRPRGQVSLPQLVAVASWVDHPGTYPRNPWGKGYVVGQPPDSGELAMPNLEDPLDLLTPERLVVRDASRWYEQPLPWCFDWVPALSFPRCTHFGRGVDAWFPGPEDEHMPEVARGFLEASYRGRAPGILPAFYQEASHGLVIPELPAGELVRVQGMRPDGRSLELRLPERRPRIVFSVEGKAEAPSVRLHSVVVRPHEARVTCVLGATIRLPRAFVPGLHKHVDVSVSVDGDAPIGVEMPTTVLDEVAGGNREDAST